jgi:lipoprotein NlpI
MQSTATTSEEKSGTTATQLQGLTTKEWNIKGVALGKSGRYEEVLPCFDNALEMDPQNVRALRSKSVALEEIRKTTPQK